ncbi:helix-turn-helix transcriptional regulator [Paraburkholderia phenazinium]|uniref:HTH-type transcriptional regulator / antitoxin HipB n=1 Tax=Paraburkholderia phenazinium TaxID=60549 RepID=A0A1G8NTN1_9BURK|nr:helix-turn-helix transcriptional regulator [Paraburkholderia phenazinium]SDI83286.1 HTH-type transcriptional regulator / antitoxin HipB [Paraburkholderia phenazinium]
MDYPVKTPHQLRPLLVGFRKAAGLTQAQVAARLGITQQTYAQLEAKPESTSLDRLFHILKILRVSIVLTLPSSGPALREGGIRGRARIVEAPVAAKPGAAKKRGTTAQVKPAIGAESDAAPRGRGQAAPKPATKTQKGAIGGAAPRKREDW